MNDEAVCRTAPATPGLSMRYGESDVTSDEYLEIKLRSKSFLKFIIQIITDL